MRKPAMNVNVFQWPCGTLATRRSPRGARPEWRTILVVTDVSSIKMSRLPRKDNCSAFSSARAAATSGRSCSAACNVFFERDVVTVIKPPDRGSADLQLFGRCEPRNNLVEYQIGLSSHQIEQPPLVLLKRRAAVAGAGLRRHAAGCLPAIHPADGRRGWKIKQASNLTAAVTGLDQGHNTNSQVQRLQPGAKDLAPGWSANADGFGQPGTRTQPRLSAHGHE